MDSRSTNNQFRSTPLMGWDEVARMRSEAQAGGFDDAERAFDERMARAKRDENDRHEARSSSGWMHVADDGQQEESPSSFGWRPVADDSQSRRSATRDRGSVWERAKADVAEASSRSRREHVSGYVGESTAGRVTSRSERGRERWTTEADESRRDRSQRSMRGFMLVEDEAGSQERRTERQSSSNRSRRARVVYSNTDAYMSSDAAPTLRRQEPVESDDPYAEDVAAEWTGRSSIVDALCFIPESIGSAILGVVGHIHLGGLLIMAAVALTVAMLYNPTRDLYLANRRIDTLQETYDALLAQNKQLEYEIEVLQTREGIENEARARGYVEPGETKVVVQGLPEAEGEGVSAYTITDEELPDNRPWYVRVLDTVFGYDPET